MRGELYFSGGDYVARQLCCRDRSVVSVQGATYGKGYSKVKHRSPQHQSADRYSSFLAEKSQLLSLARVPSQVHKGQCDTSHQRYPTGVLPLSCLGSGVRQGWEMEVSCRAAAGMVAQGCSSAVGLQQKPVWSHCAGTLQQQVLGWSVPSPGTGSERNST